MKDEEQQSVASYEPGEAGVQSRGRIVITYGIYRLDLDLAGNTVGQLRTTLEQSLNIDPRSVAVLNGEAAAEDTILKANDRLEFVRLAGQKG